LNIRILVPGSLLALSLLIGAGSISSHAKDGQNSAEGHQAPLNGANVAAVDMKRIYDASAEPQLFQEKATETAVALQQMEKRITGVPYLELQELAEFINLLAAPNPAPAQEARIMQLKTLSDTRAQELDALQRKPAGAVNAADKQRMATLLAASNALQTRMQIIDSDLMRDRDEKLVEFRTEQMRRLREVAGKVAASHGILQVFSAEVLVYSATDITIEVIQKVKRK